MFSSIQQTLKEYSTKLLNNIIKYQTMENETIYFDFETTGLNQFHLKIIEYAFLIEDYELSDKSDYNETNDMLITSLINPKIKFDKIITDITGIHPDILEDKPTIEDKLESIEEFINYSESNVQKFVYLVAHNGDNFDKIILQNTCKMYNSNNINKIQYKEWKFIDTLLLAKKLIPKLKSYSQKNLATHFNLKSSNHRALDDTIVLRKIYHKLIELLANEMSITKIFLLENPQIVYAYLY
jgi:DNA polymerase III subunit epsilon